MTDLVVLGAGNALDEVAELVADINAAGGELRLVGALDDAPHLHGTTSGAIRVEGPLSLATRMPAETRFVFAVGSYRTRMVRPQILQRLALPEERFHTLVHPSAKIFSSASLGHGCIVHHGSVVFGGSRLEPFVVVSALSVIATNNLVGRGALIASGVITTDRAAIGPCAHIGQGVLVAENCEIGAGAQIGMGALVMQNVKAGAFGIGTPLRFLDRVEVPAAMQEEWERSKARFRHGDGVKR
jgi:sugar O-acyltransferase (sialic acid O-acetyltransferase NeuD family)